MRESVMSSLARYMATWRGKATSLVREVPREIADADFEEGGDAFEDIVDGDFFLRSVLEEVRRECFRRFLR